MEREQKKGREGNHVLGSALSLLSSLWSTCYWTQLTFSLCFKFRSIWMKLWKNMKPHESGFEDVRTRRGKEGGRGRPTIRRRNWNLRSRGRSGRQWQGCWWRGCEGDEEGCRAPGMAVRMLAPRVVSSVTARPLLTAGVPRDIDKKRNHGPERLLWLCL